MEPVIELAPTTALVPLASSSRLVSGDLLVNDEERQAVAGWLLSKRSAHTRKAYGRDLATFLSWCHGLGERLATVTPGMVEAWCTWQLEADAATASVARRVSAVSSFYQWATKAGRLYEGRANPASAELIDRVKASSVHTPALTMAEVQLLLGAARHSRYHPDRDLALVLLLVSTGLRVSEMIAADFDNVSYDSGVRMLVVEQGKGRRTRTVALDPYVYDLLTKTGRDTGPLVVSNDGERLTERRASRILARLGRAAGINTFITPHVLRATYITIGSELGARVEDLQANVGHGDPRQTQAYIRRSRSAQQQGALASQVVAAVNPS